MAFPRPDDDSKAFFLSVLPDDPSVRALPVFGNLAGFVNSSMFMGIFGSAVFVSLADSDRSELLREEGAAVLEAMEGQPMKGVRGGPERLARRAPQGPPLGRPVAGVGWRDAAEKRRRGRRSEFKNTFSSGGRRLE